MNSLQLHRGKRSSLVRQLLLGVLGLFVFGFPNPIALPQVDSESSRTHTPYARMGDIQPDYRGPGRASEQDIRTSEINIGLMLPLDGPQAKAGRTLELAAQMAIEEVNAEGGYRGRKFRLQTRNSAVPWGKASSELVDLIYSDQVVALITSFDGAIAHLAEQVANKVGVPVMSLAPDPTTTEINLPWIFRAVPSDKEQVEILKREILDSRDFGNIAVVWQDSREGRSGTSAFQGGDWKSVSVHYLKLARNPSESDFHVLKNKLCRAAIEAVVLWTEPTAAARIVQLLREASPSTEIYLSVISARPPFFKLIDTEKARVRIIGPFQGKNHSGIASRFPADFKDKMGALPSPMTMAAFDSVLMLAKAVQGVGPNRARVRDSLASGFSFTGTTGVVIFDPEGNLRTAWRITPPR